MLLIIPVIIVATTAPAMLISSANDIRSFFANLAICAPYLSDAEEEMLRARFAGVGSKKDFMAIHAELSQIAGTNEVGLARLPLW